MKQTLLTFALIAITTILITADTGPKPADRGLVIQAETQQLAYMTAETLERFQNAGFIIPENTHIHVYEDNEKPCYPHKGGKASWGGEHPTINVCNGSQATLQHELGHIWASENLNQTEQEQWTFIAKAETWNNQDTPWKDRGGEHLAELFTWGFGYKNSNGTILHVHDYENLAAMWAWLATHANNNPQELIWTGPHNIDGSAHIEDNIDQLTPTKHDTTIELFLAIQQTNFDINKEEQHLGKPNNNNTHLTETIYGYCDVNILTTGIETILNCEQQKPQQGSALHAPKID